MANNEINKNIDNNQENSEVEKKKQPDEQGGIHLQSHIKIFDPETTEVFVNGRA
jgi:hypothetical protein